jgi:hypothetical protein
MEVVYLDTSVFGGIFDKEFSEFSGKLLETFKKGKRIMMLSDLVMRELKGARKEVRQQASGIPKRYMIMTANPLKAYGLAARYIAEGALTLRSKDDALHIATATLQNADCLASWNFKHMANTTKIDLFNKINNDWGFRSIKIKTPYEILNP